MHNGPTVTRMSLASVISEETVNLTYQSKLYRQRTGDKGQGHTMCAGTLEENCLLTHPVSEANPCPLTPDQATSDP